jgi:hypothetical protein
VRRAIRLADCAADAFRNFGESALGHFSSGSNRGNRIRRPRHRQYRITAVMRLVTPITPRRASFALYRGRRGATFQFPGHRHRVINSASEKRT